MRGHFPNRAQSSEAALAGEGSKVAPDRGLGQPRRHLGQKGAEGRERGRGRLRMEAAAAQEGLRCAPTCPPRWQDSGGTPASSRHVLTADTPRPCCPQGTG